MALLLNHSFHVELRPKDDIIMVNQIVGQLPVTFGYKHADLPIQLEDSYMQTSFLPSPMDWLPPPILVLAPYQMLTLAGKDAVQVVNMRMDLSNDCTVVGTPLHKHTFRIVD